LVVCYDAAHEAYLREKFIERTIDLTRVSFAIAPSNDSWARDHGPLTVCDEQEKVFLLNFQFNGWGLKYAFESDNRINSTLHKQTYFSNLEPVDFILEGGSIEINSKHELLTTTHCLLSENRNGLSRAETELKLKKYLGCRQVHWLEHGYLAGDDTDSHVDTLARFVNDTTIAYVKCDDAEDEHFAELAEMELELQALKNLTGKPYNLVPLPWPQAQFDDSGQRLPLTYANFLIINNAVLVPNFADPADKAAEKCLTDLFPERDIIGVPSKEIVKQFGSLHCLSMQLPKGTLND
jgi:agmatine/peptidylarginine deiminase